MAVIRQLGYILLLLVVLAQQVAAADVVHNMSQNLTVNKTFTLDGGGTTPVSLWVGAIILGILLIILSCHLF